MTAGRKINSNSQDWNTPPKYVSVIKDFFHGKIDLDPCSNEYSTIGAEVEYRLPEKDGLEESWNYKHIFVNPPYGRDKERGTSIKDWLKKGCETHKDFGSEIIFLVPVATNTSHWKEYVFKGKATAICFLYDTRLKFYEKGKEVKKGAPMACCLIYYGNNIQRFKEFFNSYGAIVMA